MSEKQDPGLLAEIFHYAKTNKSWWLIPLVAVFVVLAVLIVIGEIVPVVTPFIYTLF